MIRLSGAGPLTRPAQGLRGRLGRRDWEQLPKPGFMEGRAGAQLALDGTDATGWTSALLLT
ncbi:hypothetical protein [Streptomyces olivochromogenes]|uniref:hypothetical protein n=1 Tax=Streptomyces olivochromogenes TaxID=1963 RepID=UPI0036A2CD64